MARYDYDFYVIGAGSGGVRASRMAASYGARTAVAESGPLGGTCVNVGCIPKKLFVYGAHYSDDFRDAQAYGWATGGSSPALDWQRLRDNKNAEIGRLNGVYASMLEASGVALHRSRVRLGDAHTIEVDGQRVTADKILVATGSWPYVPDIPGREHVLTSNEMFYLDSLPTHATVVGGGYIAVEFAGILNGLGVDTTLIYRRSLFLRGFDDGVRSFVADEVAKKGIKLRFDSDVNRVEKRPSGKFALHLRDDVSTSKRTEGANILETDLVMYATGRDPNVSELGLEAHGVGLAPNGAVQVDAHLKSSVDSIYAIGDVIDRYQLTPVAITEGMAVARTLFREMPTEVDYESIPTAVFCHPDIGTVGLSEAAARERAPSGVDIYESTFRPLKHTMTASQERTFMKVIVNQADDRVMGVHMVGPEAAEIIQGLSVAVKSGATKADFDATVAIHPTAAEEFVTMREPVRS